MDDTTEHFVTVCLLNVQSFFELIYRKNAAGKRYMDGWMDKITKNRRKYYFLTGGKQQSVQCINIKA